MAITPNSLASVNGASVRNVQFKTAIRVVERKVVVIGTYDPLLTEVVDEEPVRVFNANDGGSKFGFGFMLHRLLFQIFAGSNGNVSVFAIPQAEVAGDASAGDVDFTGTTGVVAGTMYFYIASLVVEVALTTAMTAAEICAALVSAINADKDLPVTAAINATPEIADITAKSKGPWGDDITIAFNLRPGESLPAGVIAAITDMTGGSGVPDVQDALDAMGVGDNQNEEFFTDLICGYGQDTSTFDKISVYNGIGNEFVGNYKQEVSRFFRALAGDTVAGTAGLDAMIALADLRKETDRTNGVLGVPDNYHHPMELAACAMGVMAEINNTRAQQTYVNRVLPGIIPGPGKDRWTDNYTSGRDLAVKNGVATTQVKNNTVTLQDVITFYRPEAVTPVSNGFRSMRNISLLQNITFNLKANFELEKWQGITIVEDTGDIDDRVDAEKAKDDGNVIDDLLALNELFAGKSWLYNESFGVEKLKAEPDRVSLRDSGRGWDIYPPILLSGEGGIFNTIIEFDVSLAVVLD